MLEEPVKGGYYLFGLKDVLLVIRRIGCCGCSCSSHSRLSIRDWSAQIRSVITSHLSLSLTQEYPRFLECISDVLLRLLSVNDVAVLVTQALIVQIA